MHGHVVDSDIMNAVLDSLYEANLSETCWERTREKERAEKNRTADLDIHPHARFVITRVASLREHKQPLSETKMLPPTLTSPNISHLPS